MSTEMERIVESMKMIQQDCVTDAAELHHKPFTGAAIGPVFGNLLAMVEACARAIESIARDAQKGPDN